MDNESVGLGPPYGPVANLKTIFNTWRDRSMPEQVDKDWLERIGISPHLTAKNLHALRFLGLIDDLGFATPVAGRLRVASAEEYPSVLEEIIRKAYRFVFEIRDPAVDARNRIEDPFRKEMPQAQRSRMVALFLGLCQLALMPLKEAPPTRAPRDGKQAPRKPREMSAAAADNLQPLLERSSELRRVDSAVSVLREAPGLDPILRQLINTLPQIDSADELDKWYTVFRSAFSLVCDLKAKAAVEAST